MLQKRVQKKHTDLRVDGTQPAPDVEPYEISVLDDLRERLNASKSKLDKYYLSSKTDEDVRSKWYNFQNLIDIYKPMRFEIQSKFRAKFVTNAWMKYWEIFSHYGVIPSTPITAFFNAELPGATLCAFNHYMRTMRPRVQFNWRASSLLRSDASKNEAEALGDDYGLYANNRANWLMGQKMADSDAINNGDVTNIDVIRDFARKIGPGSAIDGVHLYSHDAGIDVSVSDTGDLGFNDQEMANAHIHLGSALCGFVTLRKGGCFIAKQYTFFETFTWNLILIYATMFREFFISKPLTSRQYNSEIYLIGKGFLGIDEQILNLLSERVINFNTLPFIPRDTIGKNLQTITDAADVIHGQQIAFLDENVELFEKYKDNLSKLRSEIDPIRWREIAEWFRRYPVRKIRAGDNLKYKVKSRKN